MIKKKQHDIKIFKNFLNSSDKNELKELFFDSFKHVLPLRLRTKKRLLLEDKKLHKALIDFRKKNPREFGKIYDRFKIKAQVRSFFFKKKFLKLFAKILNIKIKNLYISGFMLRLDAPEDKKHALDWHQDSAYYHINYPKFNSYVAYVPLTSNTSINGTIQYVPRSNSRLLPHKRNKIKYSIKLTKSEMKKVKNFNINFGDVGVFHTNLKHRSGINNSKKIRTNLLCRFYDMSDSFNEGNEQYIFKSSGKTLLF